MENTHKNLPRDVFLYLLMVVGLGMVAVNLGTLWFQFVNIYLPDPVTDMYHSASSYHGLIRWAVSALVIVFPVFLWVSRFLSRDIAAHPDKRDLKIRKWLLYLTLFVASIVIVGDLIALIYSFMQGELTTRFLLKILAILLIAGSILYYYLNELKEHAQSSRLLNVFPKLVIGAVLISLVAGFAVAGSPKSQRLVRFDEQRVGDLQNIQWQIINYWQSKSRLPDNLDQLRDDISGFVPPTDPVTARPYSYSVVGSLKFTLCADFQTSTGAKSNAQGLSVPAPYGAEVLDSWSHDSGQVCFERTIDPERHAPVKPLR